MPNIFFTILAVFALLTAHSCKPDVKERVSSTKIFQSYNKQPGVALISIPPRIVSIILDESQKGNPELKNIIDDSDHLSFLIFHKGAALNTSGNICEEIGAKLDSIDFTDLIQFNSGKEIIWVKVQNYDTIVYKEVVFLVSNQHTLFCISFMGDIDQKKVSELVKPENIGVLSHLERLNRP